MRNAIERWGAESWTTPVYHPRANLVERRHQEIKKRWVRMGHGTPKYPPYYFRLGIDATTRQDTPPRYSSSAEKANGRAIGHWLGQDSPIGQINTDREKREKDVLDNGHTICGNKWPDVHQIQNGWCCVLQSAFQISRRFRTEMVGTGKAAQTRRRVPHGPIRKNHVSVSNARHPQRVPSTTPPLTNNSG